MRQLKLRDMIYAGAPTDAQVDRIVEFHMEPLNEIAHSVHIDHVVCFRSKEHEARSNRRPETDKMFTKHPVLAGRKFWSEHCFEPSAKQPEGKGACDLSSRNLLSLASLLVQHIPYCRYALYEAHKFIHCDYAWGFSEPKYYDAGWAEITEHEFFDRIEKMI